MLQKCSQNAPRKLLRLFQTYPKVSQRVLKWPQDAPNGAKMARVGAKMAQDGAKMAQDGPKMAEDGSNGRSGRPKTAPRRPPESSLSAPRPLSDAARQPFGLPGLQKRPKGPQNETKMAPEEQRRENRSKLAGLLVGWWLGWCLGWCLVVAWVLRLSLESHLGALG